MNLGWDPINFNQENKPTEEAGKERASRVPPGQRSQRRRGDRSVASKAVGHGWGKTWGHGRGMALGSFLYLLR